MIEFIVDHIWKFKPNFQVFKKYEFVNCEFVNINESDLVGTSNKTNTRNMDCIVNPTDNVVRNLRNFTVPGGKSFRL